ncbi:hypothetical protein TorRG33x02_163850 [Trema orientale]|uniref:Uncharacterized protein n=1 Tax=Trema orientale TaxID=63057 RepID=A0A2P5EQL0_TREOI|nr:hypothetical protein TorRG33x02_163850 [Trema orientale]
MPLARVGNGKILSKSIVYQPRDSAARRMECTTRQPRLWTWLLSTIQPWLDSMLRICLLRALTHLDHSSFAT